MVSFLDIVGDDSIDRSTLATELTTLERKLEGAKDLPVEERTQKSWLKYHISPQGYREEANWLQDFRNLRDFALGLFDSWSNESG